MSQIVGNPVPIKIGRKVYLIGYVSMSEYMVFRDMFKVDYLSAIMQLLYYSLVRGGSIKWNVRRKIRRLFKKYPTALLTMVETITDLSLPDVKPKDGDGEGADVGENIKTTYRVLAKLFTWTPPEISDMSPAQIVISMTGGPNCDGTMKQSWGEYAASKNRGLN